MEIPRLSALHTPREFEMLVATLPVLLGGQLVQVRSEEPHSKV